MEVTLITSITLTRSIMFYTWNYIFSYLTNSSVATSLPLPWTSPSPCRGPSYPPWVQQPVLGFCCLPFTWIFSLPSPYSDTCVTLSQCVETLLSMHRLQHFPWLSSPPILLTMLVSNIPNQASFPYGCIQGLILSTRPTLCMEAHPTQALTLHARLTLSRNTLLIMPGLWHHTPGCTLGSDITPQAVPLCVPSPHLDFSSLFWVPPNAYVLPSLLGLEHPIAAYPCPQLRWLLYPA